MAVKKTKADAKRQKTTATADYELRKAFDKMRKDFAGLVGEVARVDADMKRGVETAKTAKNVVSKLMKDPLVQVPQDTARRVDVLEAEVRRLKAKIADRALVTSLDEVKDSVKTLQRQRDETDATVGDHGDRIQALEEAATEPLDHAHPPDHPKPDARQTTLDDAIARSRAKTVEVPVVGGVKDKDGGPVLDPADEDHEERAERAGEMPS